MFSKKTLFFVLLKFLWIRRFVFIVFYLNFFFVRNQTSSLSYFFVNFTAIYWKQNCKKSGVSTWSTLFRSDQFQIRLILLHKDLKNQTTVSLLYSPFLMNISTKNFKDTRWLHLINLTIVSNQASPLDLLFNHFSYKKCQESRRLHLISFDQLNKGKL